jgi:hypothetical protein
MISLQFNPDSLVRTLRRCGGGEEPGRANAHGIHGPPAETITLTVGLDAPDSSSSSWSCC